MAFVLQRFDEISRTPGFEEMGRTNVELGEFSPPMPGAVQYAAFLILFRLFFKHRTLVSFRNSSPTVVDENARLYFTLFAMIWISQTVSFLLISANIGIINLTVIAFILTKYFN